MLKIALRPSRMLTAILLIAHGAAIVLIVLVGLPPWLQVIAIGVLVASLAFYVRQTALLRSPDAVIAIEIASDDAFSIQTRRGDWLGCEVLGSTYVASFLTLLNLRELDKGAVRHAAILPDSTDAEDFRRLRVWLRWKRVTPPG
jgi:toxin CptA